MKIIDQKEKRSIILIRGFFTLLSMGIIAFGVIAYQEQAGVLAKDGIAFSFGTMSVKTGDFSKNITTTR